MSYSCDKNGYEEIIKAFWRQYDENANREYKL